MDLCDVLRDRRKIEACLEALRGDRECTETDARTVAALRELLLHHGRAANSLYGALMHKGAHPGAILCAMEAHAVAFQVVCERQRYAPGAVPVSLLRSLVAEYFEEQEPVLAQARALLSSGHERELAAELPSPAQ
jgi:hypothetical protein